MVISRYPHISAFSPHSSPSGHIARGVSAAKIYIRQDLMAYNPPEIVAYSFQKQCEEAHFCPKKCAKFISFRPKVCVKCPNTEVCWWPAVQTPDANGKRASPMHIVLGCIQVNPVKYHVSKIPKPQIAESPPPLPLWATHFTFLVQPSPGQPVPCRFRRWP